MVFRFSGLGLIFTIFFIAISIFLLLALVSKFGVCLFSAIFIIFFLVVVFVLIRVIRITADFRNATLRLQLRPHGPLRIDELRKEIVRVIDM